MATAAAPPGGYPLKTRVEPPNLGDVGDNVQLNQLVTATGTAPASVAQTAVETTIGGTADDGTALGTPVVWLKIIGPSGTQYVIPAYTQQ